MTERQWTDYDHLERAVRSFLHAREARDATAEGDSLGDMRAILATMLTDPNRIEGDWLKRRDLGPDIMGDPWMVSRPPNWVAHMLLGDFIEDMTDAALRTLRDASDQSIADLCAGELERRNADD